MHPDPFPDPGDDAQEPDSSAPPAGPRPPAEPDDEPGQQQGLFLCLPAGSLDPDQFAQSGPAKDVPPDPLLATVIDAVLGEDGKGLAGCSDDQLIGIIAAIRRLESRAAWSLITAVAEFTARTDDEPCAAEFAADQLACELHLTNVSAAEQMSYARTVTTRLPASFAALRAGLIHPVHLKIIAEETAILSAKDAARADAILAGIAGSLTFGKLGAAARRLVLELDPESAERRKQNARQDAHVRPFRETSGNAGLIGRELPPDEVLASMQHLEQRALDLRAAGIPGTLQDLRVRAYLDLLQERDTRHDPQHTSHAADAHDTGDPSGSSGSGLGPDGNSGSGSDGSPDGNGGSGPGSGGPGPDGGGRGRQLAPDTGPSLAALVNITVPWSAVAGQSGSPADVAGLGLVHASDARDLLAAAARDPRTRWCVTALHPDGTAAAHGCAAGRHPPPGIGPDPPSAREWISRLRITMTPIARGTCGHDRAEPGYRPSRKLTHLIQVRNARCTAPGCGRAAARCDLDHTVAWDQGGLTCECDLAPLCRHHHRCKQADGWRLEQPEPGVLRWRTPAGRTYETRPTRYPV